MVENKNKITLLVCYIHGGMEHTHTYYSAQRMHNCIIHQTYKYVTHVVVNKIGYNTSITIAAVAQLWFYIYVCNSRISIEYGIGDKN